MTVAFIVGEQMPIDCGGCSLWVKRPMGYTPYCQGGGKYTEEEIMTVKDGALDMYYKGYLIDNIPKNCPLVEI